MPLPVAGPTNSATPTASLSAGQIYDVYNHLSQDENFKKTYPDIATFAKAGNQESPGMFDAGKDWNAVRTGALKTHELFQNLGLGSEGPVGDVGAALGGLLGQEDAGRQALGGLPEQLASAGVGALAGSVVPGVGTAAGAIGGFSADSALETYGDTGKVLPSVVSGVAGALMPGAGHIGESVAANLIGRRIASTALEDGIRVSDSGPFAGLLEKGVEKAGQVVGLSTANELTRQAVNVAMGQGLSLPGASDLVGNLVGTIAPMGLDMFPGVHGQPEGQPRSLSEAMNIAQAAKTVINDNMSQAAKDAISRAKTTLGLTAAGDAERATIDPTEILNPANDADVNVTGNPGFTLKGQPYDPNTTVFGRTLLGDGVIRSGNTTNPELPYGESPRRVNVDEVLPPEPGQTQPSYPKPTLTLDVEGKETKIPNDNAGELDDRQEGKFQMQEGQEAPKPEVPQDDYTKIPNPHVIESLPEPIRQLALDAPKPVSHETVIATAAKLPAKVVTLADFKQVSDMHNELMQQVDNNPHIDVPVQPITDAWLNQNIQGHVDNGHSYDDAVAMTGQQALNKTKTDLSRVNQALYEHNERAAEAAQPNHEASNVSWMLNQFERQPGLAETVADGVSRAGGDVPINIGSALRNWIQRSRMSGDADTIHVLKQLAEKQKAEGRMSEPALREFLKGKIGDEQINDIVDQNEEMFKPNGLPSGHGVFQKVVMVKWNPDLAAYLKAVHRNEEKARVADVSLDHVSEGDEGEGRAFQDSAAANHVEIQRAVAERHEDPIARQTAAQMAEQRASQVRATQETLQTMSHKDIKRVLMEAKLPAPNNIERFKQQLITYIDGINMFGAGTSGAGPEGKGVGRERGGLYPWLAKHQEYEGTKTNINRLVKSMDAFLSQAGLGKAVRSGKPEGTLKATGMPDESKVPLTLTTGERNIAKIRTLEGLQGASKTAEVDLPNTEVPNAISFSTQDFFTRYYRNMGLEPGSPQFKAFVTSAVKIAHLYPQIDKTKVGQLVGVNGMRSSGALGLYFQRSFQGRNQKYVTMLADHFASSTENNAFIRNLVLAHEFHHSLFETASEEEASGSPLSEAINAAYDVSKSLSHDDKKVMLQGMADLIVPKELVGDRAFKRELDNQIDYASGRQKDDETHQEEFLSTFSGMLSLGMANPAKFHELTTVKHLLDVLPDKLRQFTEGYYANLHDFSDGVKGYFNEMQPGLGDKYVTMADIYKKLARTSSEVQTAMDSFRELEANGPMEFLNKVQQSKGLDAFTRQFQNGQRMVAFVSDLRKNYGVPVTRIDAVKANKMVEQARDYFTPDSRKAPTYGKEPGLFWWATPLAQFGEKFPVLRPLADVLLGYEGAVRNATARAMLPFGLGRNGERDDKLTVLNRISGSKTMRKAYSDVARWQNENGKVAQESDVARLTGLSGQSLEDVHGMLQATSASMQQVAKSNVETQRSISSNLLAALVGNSNDSFTAKQSKQIGSAVFEASLKGDAMQDPMVQSLISQYGLPSIAPLLDPASRLAANYQKFAGLMEKADSFSSETRPNKFVVKYADPTRQGGRVAESYETEKAALDRRDELAKRTGVSNIELINPWGRGTAETGYNESAVNHFMELEQIGIQFAQKAFTGDPSALQDFLNKFSPGAGLVKEMQSMGMKKHLMQREFVGGREDIDMLQNNMNYIQAQLRANARAHIRNESMALQTDPTLKQEKRLLAVYNDHMENVLNPPSQVNKAVRDMTSLYYVGGNFSSALLTALQPLQATLPHLTRQGTGVLGGLKYLKDATAYTVRSVMGKQKGDPIVDQLLKRAESAGLVDAGTTEGAFGHNDSFITNISNLANDSGEMNTAGKLTRNTMAQVSNVASWAMRKATEHNHRVAFLASVLAARDQGQKAGLSGDQLTEHMYGEGKRTVEVTMHAGGAAARPVGFGQLSGGLYGAAGNLYVLNHFTTSMMSMFSRWGTEALGRSGLQGAELHNARKAFATAMATQMVLAGALGLPFAGATVALLEKMFPNLELNKNMREFFASLGGDDAQAGGLIADSALQGLGTSLSPVDMSGRLGMGSILGDNPYFGFNAQDILGATGSMFENLFKGASAASTGDWHGAQSLLPIALQKMVQGFGDNGALRDKSGNLVYQQSPTEQVLSAAGFRPKELAHAQEQKWIANRSEQIQQRELQMFYQEQETKLGQGDFAGVRQSLYARAAEDKTFSPLVGLRRIVEGYQKSQYVENPANMGKIGDASEKAQLQRAFGNVQPAGPTMMQRLQEKQAAERAVGIPGAGSVTPQMMSQAMTVDFLKQQGLTELQARLAFSEMTTHHEAVGQVVQQ